MWKTDLNLWIWESPQPNEIFIAPVLANGTPQKQRDTGGVRG